VTGTHETSQTVDGPVDPLATAQRFEREGQLTQAAHAFGRAGRWDVAAELLIWDGLVLEAAECLLRTLPATPTAAKDLTPTTRRAALAAGRLYQLAGHPLPAASLWLALGDRQAATTLLRRYQTTVELHPDGSAWPLPSPWSPGRVHAALPPRGRRVGRARLLEPSNENLTDRLARLTALRPDHPGYPGAVRQLLAGEGVESVAPVWLLPFAQQAEPRWIHRAALLGLRSHPDATVAAAAAASCQRLDRQPAPPPPPPADEQSRVDMPAVPPQELDALRREAEATARTLHLGAISPGTVIDGRYRVDSPLGKGAAAVVLLVTDLESGAPAALKLLRHDHNDPAGAARFEREVRLAGSLEHPNIVRLLDSGTFGGNPYFTMEAVDGMDMNRLMRSWGEPPPVPVSVRLVSQALAGLAFAHARGVLHRDIKPSNLLVAREPTAVKLTDFGLAFLAGENRLTMPGRVVGSPKYMAPEVLVSTDTVAALPATDVYGVGVVLYKLLTGVAPFEARNIAALFHAIRQGNPPPPSRRNDRVPPWLDALTLRMLSVDPADRPADGGEALAVVHRGMVEG